MTRAKHRTELEVRLVQAVKKAGAHIARLRAQGDGAEADRELRRLNESLVKWRKQDRAEQ